MGGRKTFFFSLGVNEKGVRGGIENFPALAGSERRGKSFPPAVHNLMRKGSERRWGNLT